MDQGARRKESLVAYEEVSRTLRWSQCVISRRLARLGTGDRQTGPLVANHPPIGPGSMLSKNGAHLRVQLLLFCVDDMMTSNMTAPMDGEISSSSWRCRVKYSDWSRILVELGLRQTAR